MVLWRLLPVLLLLVAVAAFVFSVVEPSQALGASGVRDDVRAVGIDPVVPGFPIDYVAITWDAPDDHPVGDESHGSVRFRYDGEWGPWIGFVEEGAQAPGQWSSGLVFADGAEAYQIRSVPGWANSPRAIAISAAPVTLGSDPGPSASALSDAGCVSRAEWGADESKRFEDNVESWEPTFFSVQGLIVHHTVTANDDPDPAATVRAIYHQHTVLNGWGDIGYHYLIDASGRVYEGRVDPFISRHRQVSLHHLFGLPLNSTWHASGNGK